MVELATCSYSEFRESMGLPVQVSLGLPKFQLWYAADWNQQRVWEITPRHAYLRASDGEFTRRYLEQVQGYGADAIRRKFENLARVSGADRLVLLCFEGLRTKGPNACHRRMFAKWWEQETGEVVPELGAMPVDLNTGPVLDRGGGASSVEPPLVLW